MSAAADGQRRAGQPRRHDWAGQGAVSRPLFIGTALVLGIVAALVYAAVVMGAPPREIEHIAVILLTTGAGTLLLSAALSLVGFGVFDVLERHPAGWHTSVRSADLEST